MEEIEVPIEKIQEEMNEHALEHSAEAKHGGQHPNWVAQVALTSAILAVFAAISALLAGHHSNEAMIEQIKASDHWSHYQAKSIKSAILTSRADLLQAFGKPVDEKIEAKIESYKKDQEELTEAAKDREKESEFHLRVHQGFARAVTLFQIGLTIAAISVLTKRRHFWWISLGFGAIGLFSFIQGFLIK